MLEYIKSSNIKKKFYKHFFLNQSARISATFLKTHVSENWTLLKTNNFWVSEIHTSLNFRIVFYTLNLQFWTSITCDWNIWIVMKHFFLNQSVPISATFLKNMCLKTEMFEKTNSYWVSEIHTSLNFRIACSILNINYLWLKYLNILKSWNIFSEQMCPDFGDILKKTCVWKLNCLENEQCLKSIQVWISDTYCI